MARPKNYGGSVVKRSHLDDLGVPPILENLRLLHVLEASTDKLISDLYVILCACPIVSHCVWLTAPFMTCDPRFD